MKKNQQNQDKPDPSGRFAGLCTPRWRLGASERLNASFIGINLVC